MSQVHGRRSPVAILISTLTVLAILGMAVTAKHGQRNASNDLANLESDLRLQLKLAFRHDTDQYEARLEQLRQLLEAWLSSPRTIQDESLLTDWFHKAIRRSMPGKGESLPEIPQFSTFDPPESEALASSDKQVMVREKPFSSDTPESPVVEEAPATVELPLEESVGQLAENHIPVGFPYSDNSAVQNTQSSPVVTTMVERHADNHQQPEPALDVQATLNSEQVASAPLQLPLDDPTSTSSATPSSDQLQESLLSDLSDLSDQVSWQTPIPVNLARLARRIVQYHHGIDEIEAVLRDLHQGEISKVRQPLLRLQKLAADYRFVKLYYDTLSDQERWAIESPRSLEPLCDEFSGYLNRKYPLTDGDYLGSIDSDADGTNGSKLQKLRADLAWITSHLEQ